MLLSQLNKNSAYPENIKKIFSVEQSEKSIELRVGLEKLVLEVTGLVLGPTIPPNVVFVRPARFPLVGLHSVDTDWSPYPAFLAEMVGEIEKGHEG